MRSTLVTVHAPSGPASGRASAPPHGPSGPAGPAGPDGPATRGSTSVLEREETEEDGAEGDRYAHYVRKDKIKKAQKLGRPVVALCGKVWTPRRDPSKYPVCPECKEILSQLQGE